MKHIREFDRHAKTYEKYKIIQTKVASYLVSKIEKKGKNILDLGAGSGEVYKAIDWEFERFWAMDMSQKMLDLHPDEKVEKILCSFDDEKCMKNLRLLPIDLVISSSALQWSQNLSHTLVNIAQISDNVAFAIFTSSTFASIHQMLGISSPLPSKEEIVRQISSCFMVNLETKQYRLFFPNKKELFRYIKKSGVSSGHKRASISKLRNLIQNYPFNYLEFEVVFAWSKR